MTPTAAVRATLSALFLALACLALPGSPGAAAPDQEAETLGFVPASAEDDSAAPSGPRKIVILRVPITDSILAELGNYGKVHGWIERYRLVAMTPFWSSRDRLRSLPFVELVEIDRPRFVSDVGTWDRDILDVTDVEETGEIGDPDAREVEETGDGVHVAVIDTGLIENWRDFLLEGRVRTELARAFMGGGAVGQNFVPVNEFNISNPTNLWERDTRGHGIAVASHIIGFKAGSLLVDGAAPGAAVIPLKVFPNAEAFTWASRIIAAIEYTVRLAEAGIIGPTVINLSLGGGSPVFSEERAIDDAIARGLVVVASAGNRGEAGMGWPGAFPQVISIGAVGWTRQFQPGTPEAPNRSFWWTEDVGFDPDRRSGGSEVAEAFVPGFSGRALPARDQELDVLAPGQWTVAPTLHGPLAGLFFLSGTSLSTPLASAIVALIREKNPALGQVDVQAILRSTALPVEPVDSRADILFPFDGEVVTVSWDDDCSGDPCDAVGSGLLQADSALAATPPMRKSRR